MPVIQILFYLLAAFTALWGVSGQSGLRKGQAIPLAFCYYTTQSNLITALYHLLLAAALAFNFQGLLSFLQKPAIHMSVALCITLTFLVFHFILWPDMKRRPAAGINRVDNLCVHYFCPLLTLAGWLLFADKSGLTFADAAWWLLLLLYYLIFSLIRAQKGRPFTEKGARYPYPFMDFDALGVRRASVNCAVLLVFSYGLGCLFVLLSRLIG